MAIELQADELATKVTSSSPDPVRTKPVVQFCGWLEVNGASVRLFTDPGFGEWFEIPTDKIVHQIPGVDREHDEGRSCIWVLADTVVVKCEAGTAGHFANAEPDPSPTDRKHWPY